MMGFLIMHYSGGALRPANTMVVILSRAYFLGLAYDALQHCVQRYI